MVLGNSCYTIYCLFLIVIDKHKSPEEPLKDKVLTDHHYSVIRHEVKHAPELNGMVTIKVYCVEIE